MKNKGDEILVFGKYKLIIFSLGSKYTSRQNHRYAWDTHTHTHKTHTQDAHTDTHTHRHTPDAHFMSFFLKKQD